MGLGFGLFPLGSPWSAFQKILFHRSSSVLARHAPVLFVVVAVAIQLVAILFRLSVYEVKHLACFRLSILGLYFNNF